MDDSGTTFSPTQRVALQGLIAAFAAKAADSNFDWSDLGWDWKQPKNLLAAITEDGQEITTQDLVDAALILAWSASCYWADATDTEIGEVLSGFGIGLASMDYEDT